MTMTSLRILATSAVALLAATAPAGAATVAVTPDRVVFRGAPGEANHLTLTASPREVTFAEAGRGVRIRGCGERRARVVRCPLAPGAALVVLAGDGADRVVGGARRALLHGGDGDDVLVPGSAGDALDGGRGRDLASFAHRLAPVAITLDDTPDDGAAGERANVRRTIERVAGGRAADTLAGSFGADELSGGPGADALSGGLGDDTLRGGAGDDLLAGGPADPRFGVSDGHDVLDGGAGADRVGDADHADVAIAVP